MAAQIKHRGEVYEVEPGTTVREAMLAYGIEPETVIPIRDEQPIDAEERIGENETIRLVPVISGG